MIRPAPELDPISLQLEFLAGLLVTSRTTLSAAEWWALLRRLPAVEARVLVLKVLHGLTEAEIGERLDVSRTRAWQVWQRAARRLRETPDVTSLLEAVA